MHADMDEENPDMGEENPDMDEEKPDMNGENPDMDEEDPDMDEEDPDMDEEDPDMDEDEDPDTDEEDPDMDEEEPISEIISSYTKELLELAELKITDPFRADIIAAIENRLFVRFSYIDELTEQLNLARSQLSSLNDELFSIENELFDYRLFDCRHGLKKNALYGELEFYRRCRDMLLRYCFLFVYAGFNMGICFLAGIGWWVIWGLGAVAVNWLIYWYILKYIAYSYSKI
eukprot:CFRG1800T1